MPQILRALFWDLEQGGIRLELLLTQTDGIHSQDQFRRNKSEDCSGDVQLWNFER